MLTYPIDLVCLAFVVDGGGSYTIEAPLEYEILLFSYCNLLLPILKILFV